MFATKVFRRSVDGQAGPGHEGNADRRILRRAGPMPGTPRPVSFSLRARPS
jgi:hypothetical protein